MVRSSKLVLIDMDIPCIQTLIDNKKRRLPRAHVIVDGLNSDRRHQSYRCTWGHLSCKLDSFVGISSFHELTRDIFLDRPLLFGVSVISSRVAGSLAAGVSATLVFFVFTGVFFGRPLPFFGGATVLEVAPASPDSS